MIVRAIWEWHPLVRILKAVKEIPDEDMLSDALLHIIDGNYSKVSDDDLAAVVEQLGPFMEYAAIKNSVKSGTK